VRAGLLDDHQGIVDAALPRPIARLNVEALGDHAAQRGEPHVPVLVGEEVIGLVALDLRQDVEVGDAIAVRPRQRDRPPYPEMVSEVRVVERHDARQVGEHAQHPGAAAARGAEDPHQAVLTFGDREIRGPLPPGLGGAPPGRSAALGSSHLLAGCGLCPLDPVVKRDV